MSESHGGWFVPKQKSVLLVQRYNALLQHNNIQLQRYTAILGHYNALLYIVIINALLYGVNSP